MVIYYKIIVDNLSIEYINYYYLKFLYNPIKNIYEINIKKSGIKSSEKCTIIFGC
jgi:hypothetical protein